jgi:trehalose 6-phosphate synthase
VDRNIEALVDNERNNVVRESHRTTVRAFPISIDFAHHNRLARSGTVDAELAEWTLNLHPMPEFLGIGIDRIDYTKGIPERLAAVDLLLEEHPEYRGRFVFVQVGVPSRTAIPDYHRLYEGICSQVQEINARWQTSSWRPIIFIPKHLDQPALIALHLLANFCVVSSLHDGMNLVAKEFIASRYDQDGVLILSRFTGAARELDAALQINPFNAGEIAAAMHTALTLPLAERQRRMERMRASVENNNIYRWGGKILEAISGIDMSDGRQSATEDTELMGTSAP